jgi:chromosome segregation ATPase
VRQLRADYDETCDADDKQRAEIQALRRLLFDVYTGPILGYTDDGELQDGTAHPAIDFIKDSPEQIAQAISRRKGKGGRGGELRERVAELEREWMKHPQTIEAKAQWDAVALALGADKDCPDAVRAAARDVEIAWLRQRVAELELELLALKAGAQRVENLCKTISADRDRLRAENARLIEDRARFPDRPDDVGRMIGAHVENLKAKAAAAEVAHDRVQLSLNATRAECEALTECLRECADDLESEVKTHCDLPRRVERDLEPVRRARELLAARAAREEG